MFQSLSSYFQHHHRGLSRMQWSDPQQVSTLLNHILREEQIPITMRKEILTIKSAVVVIHGLTGGARHVIVKKQKRIEHALQERTGGMLTALQFQ